MRNRANWDNLSIHQTMGVFYAPLWLFPVHMAPKYC